MFSLMNHLSMRQLGYNGLIAILMVKVINKNYNQFLLTLLKLFSQVRKLELLFMMINTKEMLRNSSLNSIISNSLYIRLMMSGSGIMAQSSLLIKALMN